MSEQKHQIKGLIRLILRFVGKYPKYPEFLPGKYRVNTHWVNIPVTYYALVQSFYLTLM